MNKDPKSILKKANAAITAGDYDGFLAYCTDDTIWNFIGEQVLNGKQEVREYMAQTYQEPPKFKVEKLISDENHVVAMGEISLKNADGEYTSYSYCDFWELKADKLHELKAYVLETGSGKASHEGQTVIGSGFSYDEEQTHTDESKLAREADNEEIIELPDLGKPNRP